MSTVGALVDRVFRDYLLNPADMPAHVGLDALVTDSAISIVYTDLELAPEEVDAMQLGTIIELGLERIRITAHDEGTQTLTVTRAMFGSTAAEHAATSLLYIAPKFSRLTVFDAVCDQIVALYPDLYAVTQDWAHSSELAFEVEATTTDPVHVVEANQWVGDEFVPVEARLVRSEDFSSGVGIQFVPRAVGEVTVRYAMAFPRPTAEADTLATLGVDASWYPIISLGVLASLLAGTDIDSATQEFITEVLESQGYPPSTGVSLAVRLTQLKELETTKARRRLLARHAPTQDYRREL